VSINIIPLDYKSLPKDVIKFIDKVKLLYNKIDTSDCYLYIKPIIRDIKTTVVLIDPLRGISTIGISVWLPSTINNTLEATNLLSGINNYFKIIADLFINDSRLLQNDKTPCYNFYSKVIFTRLSPDVINKWNSTFDQPYTTYISSDQISNLTFEILFGNEGCLITTDQISIIRGILFPEIKVKDVYDKIKVLDCKQELFAKKIPDGHYMVSGVPGSGKTVMLIARAIYLLKKNPTWYIKIVTYNRSLNSKIKSRFRQAFLDSGLTNELFDNISITTFHKMALDIAGIIVPEENINTFWQEGVVVQALTNAIPTYDAILIDEYQDFYDKWIMLCIKVTKIQTIGINQFRNIFLAGDRLQSIFNPKEHSWAKIGINIQGRSKLLKHTYRTGGSIINLALKMLMSDIVCRDEVNRFYEGNKGIFNESGISNKIQFIEGDYNLISILLQNLIIDDGYRPEEILVLCPTHKHAKVLFNSFPYHLREQSMIMRDITNGLIAITTYHSSKGLENRICILVDIDEIIDLKLIYVGMTRAFQFLYIHSTNFANSEIATNLKNNSFIEGNKNNGIPNRFTVKDILDFTNKRVPRSKPLDDSPF